MSRPKTNALGEIKSVRSDIKINPTKIPMPCHKCDKRTITCHTDCTKYKIYSIAKDAERKKRMQYNQGEEDFVTHVCNNIERIKTAKRRSRR